MTAHQPANDYHVARAPVGSPNLNGRITVIVSESTKGKIRVALVIALLVVAVVAIAASRMAPTNFERCLDRNAASWQGSGASLWEKCEVENPER